MKLRRILWLGIVLLGITLLTLASKKEDGFIERFGIALILVGIYQVFRKKWGHCAKINTDREGETGSGDKKEKPPLK